jgi:hypothetical protein
LRDFLDAILAFISCGTLSDEEWGTIDSLTDQSYTLENYNALLGILDARESVSSARDRLRYYFLAAGVQVTESTNPKSDVFIGAAL